MVHLNESSLFGNLSERFIRTKWLMNRWAETIQTFQTIQADNLTHNKREASSFNCVQMLNLLF